MALASNIHCSLLGKRGLREVALQSHAKAEYLKGEIAKIPGWTIPLSAPTFNEFVVEAPVAAAPLLSRLARRGILAGVPLSRWEPESENRFLVAVTEMNTREEMDRLVDALKETS
jgi:glycine dehydrogenase subunit 1